MASLQDINQPDPQGPMLSALGQQPQQPGMLGGMGQPNAPDQRMQWPGPPQAKPQQQGSSDFFGDLLSIAIPIAATVVGGPVAGAGATAFMASTRK